MEQRHDVPEPSLGHADPVVKEVFPHPELRVALSGTRPAQRWHSAYAGIDRTQPTIRIERERTEEDVRGGEVVRRGEIECPRPAEIGY